MSCCLLREDAKKRKNSLSVASGLEDTESSEGAAKEKEKERKKKGKAMADGDAHSSAPTTSTSTSSSNGGPTDLLLRFFDSEWFDAWIAVT